MSLGLIKGKGKGKGMKKAFINNKVSSVQEAEAGEGLLFSDLPQDRIPTDGYITKACSFLTFLIAAAGLSASVTGSDVESEDVHDLLFVGSVTLLAAQLLLGCARLNEEMRGRLSLGNQMIVLWSASLIATLIRSWTLDVPDHNPILKFYGSLVNILLSLLSLGVVCLDNMSTQTLITLSVSMIEMVSGGLLLAADNDDNSYFYSLPIISVLCSSFSIIILSMLSCQAASRLDEQSASARLNAVVMCLQLIQTASWVALACELSDLLEPSHQPSSSSNSSWGLN